MSLDGVSIMLLRYFQLVFLRISGFISYSLKLPCNLSLGIIMFFLFPLTECRVFDHSRHEDIASSCTATKFNCVEDGRDFRGTSKGIVAIYHISFVFF